MVEGIARLNGEKRFRGPGLLCKCSRSYLPRLHRAVAGWSLLWKRVLDESLGVSHRRTGCGPPNIRQLRMEDCNLDEKLTSTPPTAISPEHRRRPVNRRKVNQQFQRKRCE